MRGPKFTHPHKRICYGVWLLCLIRKNPLPITEDLGMIFFFFFAFPLFPRNGLEGWRRRRRQALHHPASLAHLPPDLQHPPSQSLLPPESSRPSAGWEDAACGMKAACPSNPRPGSRERPWGDRPWARLSSSGFRGARSFPRCEALAGLGLKREY